MKKFLLLFLALFLPLRSEEIHSYFYADFGGLYLINPAGGIGYRTQNNHQGFDLSTRVSLGLLAQVKVSALYLYYPRPNYDSQYYLGLGASALYLDIFGIAFLSSRSSYGCSAELLLGREYWSSDLTKQRFLQLQVGFPTFYFSPSLRDDGWIPMPILSYGFIF